MCPLLHRQAKRGLAWLGMSLHDTCVANQKWQKTGARRLGFASSLWHSGAGIHLSVIKLAQISHHLGCTYILIINSYRQEVMSLATVKLEFVTKRSWGCLGKSVESRHLGAGGDEGARPLPRRGAGGCGGKRQAERAGAKDSDRAGRIARERGSSGRGRPSRCNCRSGPLWRLTASGGTRRDPFPQAKRKARGRPLWLAGEFLAASPLLLPCGRRPWARRVGAAARRRRFSRGRLPGRRGAEGATRGSSASPAGEWSGRPRRPGPSGLPRAVKGEGSGGEWARGFLSHPRRWSSACSRLRAQPFLPRPPLRRGWAGSPAPALPPVCPLGKGEEEKHLPGWPPRLGQGGILAAVGSCRDIGAGDSEGSGRWGAQVGSRSMVCLRWAMTHVVKQDYGMRSNLYQ